MTEQEIEKLREKLGSDYSVKRQNGAITVELADIWRGVEFAECLEYYEGERTGQEIFQGHIYRITDWFKRELVYFDGFEYGWPVLFFKPSTESAYVEQLKAKAHGLYGEIKDGDRFDRIEMEFEDNHRIGEVRLSVHGWDYYKSDDKLYFGTICIYQQVKWAKKVDLVKVDVRDCSRLHDTDSSESCLNVKFKIFGKQGRINIAKASDHLAKCLEDYLNKS